MWDRSLGIPAVVVPLLFFVSGCSSTISGAPDGGAESADVAESSTSSSSSTTTAARPSTTVQASSAEVLVTEPEPGAVDFPEPADGAAFDEYIAGQIEGWAAAIRKATEEPSLTPEIDHLDMARFGAGEYLEINHELVRSFVEQNWMAQEPAESAVGRSVGEKNRVSAVKSIEGDTLNVLRCIVEDEDIVDSESGEVEIRGVVTVLIDVTMKKFDDGWKAVLTEVLQKTEGVAGCFLADDAEFPY